MTETQMVVTIFVLALSVWITRFLPFLIFKEEAKTPKLIDYLGKVLPAAMMGLLVIYCLKDYTISDLSTLIPALISIAAIVILHLMKQNTILSIAVGTVLYMVLIRVW